MLVNELQRLTGLEEGAFGLPGWWPGKLMLVLGLKLLLYMGGPVLMSSSMLSFFYLHKWYLICINYVS